MSPIRPEYENTVRILLAYAEAAPAPQLAAAISACPEFELEEFSGKLEALAARAITFLADILVLDFPEIREQEEQCIRQVLRTSPSARILLLTGDAVSAAIRREHVDVYLMPKSKTNFDDVVARLRVLSGKKSSGTGKSYKRPGAEARGAAILAEGALASKVIAVGASTGGTEALATFFHGLRPGIPGIVVVQHMPPVFTAMYADRLNRELPFQVTEAKDNVPIRPNTIHIAPGDCHLRVKKVGPHFFTVAGGTEKVSGHCPSVDVLFTSVANVAGANATGIILTGMGADGAEGLLKMRQRGAYTIGQDEASCVVYGMPKKAFELGAVTRQATLGDIAGVLMKHLDV